MSEAEPEKAPKPKRVMNDAQRAALAKGQAALAARRAEKKANADGLIQTTSAEIREARSAPPSPSHAPDPDDDDGDGEEFEPVRIGEGHLPEHQRSGRIGLLDDPAPRSDVVQPRPRPAAAANGNGRVRSIDDVVRRHAEPEPPSIEEVARNTRVYTMGKDPLPPPEDESRLSDGVIESYDVPDDGPDTPKSLADLMTRCPMLGDGQYYIEVTRRAPQHYGGVQCKGLQRPITRYMEQRDFVREYGGGDYLLVLYGPPRRGGAIDPRNGRPRHKALTPPVKVEISPSIYPPNLNAGLLEDDLNEGDEDDMRYMQPGFTPNSGGIGRPTTTADARMLEVQLSHEDKLREREAEKEREFRSQQSALQGQLGPMLDAVARNASESVKGVERLASERARMAEQQMAEAREEKRKAEERMEFERRKIEERLERERNRPTDTSAMMTGLATMISALKEGDNGAATAAASHALDQARQEIQRLTQNHSAELTRITGAYNTDMTRVQEKHSAEMTRLTEGQRAEQARTTELARNESERAARQHTEEMKRQEDRFKESVLHAERRAEEAERKAEQRIRETEDRAEKRIEEVRAEMRRQIDDLRAQNQQRLDDERRQHDRDTKSQSATFQTRVDGQKDMYENRLSTIAGEIVRLNADVDRWRKDAEDNKDITKHIERAEATASALGWGPMQGQEGPEPPKDWKEMVGRIGMDLVQKLPEIVQSAGETVRSIRGTPGPTPEQVQQMQYEQMMAGAQQTVPRQMANGHGMPPPLRGRDGSPFQPAPLRFGTEDGGVMDPTVPEPRPGVDMPFGQSMFTQPPVQQVMQQPMMQAPMQQQPMMQQPAPVAAMVPQVQQSAQVPMPQAPGPAAAPQQFTQAPPGSVPGSIPPEMILQFAPVLETALASGDSVENIARELMPLLGRENLAAVINGLKPERVVVELQKAGRTSSPLVRRTGQQFLRDLWQAAAKMLAGG